MEKKSKGNILLKFTRKSLRENRTRTIVTIIGIMLSMALITAVIEGAYSGLQFMVRSEVESYGQWEGTIKDLDEEKFEEFSADKEVKDSAYCRTVGWADIKSGNEYKPYLLIWSAGENVEDFIKINITNGRMPENENEILLPVHLQENGGVVYQLGDRLELAVGSRSLNGEALQESYPFMSGETLEDTSVRTYEVVGFYQRFANEIESYSCPGYTAITKGEANGPYTVFFTVHNLSGFYNYMSSQSYSDQWAAHTDLLYYSMVSKNNNLMGVLFGLTVILVLLIAFGSVTLIYNSFSISVSERTRQFGILKSIGATGKQIRASVFYEAILLAGIGIVLGCILGCAGIGITLYCLRDKFTGLIGSATGTNVEMKLVVNPVALIIAAVICLIVVMISALIPASRAMRITPIDAIRQSNDIKVNPKKVRTSKLTQKLFGIEGTMAFKNFKRNKKRARSVIISIFLSVLLFIAASSFCTYLKDSADGMTSSRNNFEVAVELAAAEGERIDYDAYLREFKGSQYVEDGAYGRMTGTSVYADIDYLLPGNEQFFGQDVNGLNEVYCYLTFIDDETFRTLCQENNIDPAQYFNSAEPMALIYNTAYYYYEENGSYKYSSFDIFDMSKAPFTVDFYMPQLVDGYAYEYREFDENGKIHAYYTKEEDHDFEHAIDMPEAIAHKQLKLGGEIKELGVYINRNNIALIYPESMLSSVVGEKDMIARDLRWATFMLKAHDHVNAVLDLEELLKTKTVGYSVYDLAQQNESVRAIILIIDVFSYGFIIIISLIAVANIFNTISTNLNLRRREIAMLKSIGLSNKGFSKMMNLECIIYGLKGLLWGLPISILVTFLIHRVTNGVYESGFYIPWHSLVIAVGSVFVVIFAAMWYTAAKIRKDNVVETLKNENL